jgi:uncharacterized protein (DUF58 family)
MEILKKVRKIEIKTRGLSNHIFSGQYHSAFKGRGMAFSEVREYQAGDDVRTIDWNVTARFNAPFVKIFEEERELTVMLLVDVSASENFGTKVQFKNELITELCAVLAFSAIQNSDKIGVILFSDRIEKYIPPKKGKQHILRIIRELVDFKPSHKGTDIKLALQNFNSVVKKRSIAFLISDFNCSGYDDDLKIANQKHDLIALKVSDPAEGELPNIGLVQVQDAETGVLNWVDTSNSKMRDLYKSYWKKLQEDTNRKFLKIGLDYTEIYTDRPYVKSLVNLFRKRGTK